MGFGPEAENTFAGRVDSLQQMKKFLEVEQIWEALTPDNQENLLAYLECIGRVGFRISEEGEVCL